MKETEQDEITIAALQAELAAKNRELEIEGALERVRATTMAMQKTAEFVDVINVIGEQFISLGFDFDWVNFSANGIDVSNGIDIWNFVVIPGKYKGADRVFIPYFDHPVFTVAYEKFQEYCATGNDFYTLALDKEMKDKFAEHLFTNTVYKDLPDEFKKLHYNDIGYLTSSVFLKDTWLSVGSYKGKPFTDEQNSILKRLGNTFGQAYTRFLDLEKAEAQAREAEIQLALERVRAVAMGMKQPSDMLEVCKIISEQLKSLDVKEIRNVQTAIIYEASHSYMNYEYYAKHDKTFITEVDFTQTDVQSAFADQMLKGNGSFFSTSLEGDKLKDFIEQQKKGPEFVDPFLFISGSLNWYWHSLGPVALGISTYARLNENEVELFKRFRNVFELAYRRYLDIEKAEAQAREAQIQLALERVRARTMAMQKSEELADVATLLFNQVTGLGIKTWTTGFNIWSDDNNAYEDWIASPGGGFIEPYVIDATAFAEFKKLSDAKRSGIEFFILYQEGEILKETYKQLSRFANKNQFEKILEEGFEFPSRQFVHMVFGSKVSLMFITYEPIPEAHDIFKRFGKVFEQTYTRFLDLQKAEAQAREAQIELGLERVRARAMAMKKSDELKELIGTVFTELTKLDLVLTRCVIMIYDTKTLGITWWMANSEDPSNPAGLFVKYHQLPPHLAYIKAWRERDLKWQYVLKGKIKKEWDDFLFVETELCYLPDFVIAGMKAPDKVYLNASFNSFGNLTLATLEPLSNEHFDILLRFAKVFDLTYTRFNDLQKAEAQARESQIEAALEKVRASAMAMRDSNDLSATASMVFTELRKLGINPIRCGVGLLTKEARKAQLYSATSTADAHSLALVGWVELSGHPVLEKIYDSWLLNEDYFPELSGEELNSYYQLLLKGLPVKVPDSDREQVQYGHFLPFSVGCLYAWSEVRYNDAEIKILKRFATIIDLTFRRYLELQISEANAREAIKTSSLDRVRAETASMRTTGDLEKITPLIWNELTTLKVPFIRCGVFIMDEEQQLIHSFLSTPEGKAIAAFQLPYDSAGEMSKVLTNWHKNEVFKDHWDEAAFAKWTKSLVEQGAIASGDTYSTAHRPVNLHLHFLPFLQGMLYVGSEAPLEDEEINLVQTLADAFSTAYARYEDFNKLESAKVQIEKTLVDLKQAQAQLVQSEKMASLGELTAGIAHEIQNPLNFVNNFSDVNTELIDELNAERLKPKAERDEQLENEILNDIKENEQKINHHGKRADAIVKGMLQHSRKSSGQKESTDINALADEYLRLSYHGLRAKDKRFNAEMKTDFDGSIGKVNIIPQDIGRVLLNLFNNAFYAACLPSKGGFKEPSDKYEPTVSVSTKKIGDKVEIKVADNGNGIPQNIVDKIFQPFFTTKPTGEGTGLGLSLAYDIIKAHGGSLKVESKEGEGSEFVIQLPVV